MKMVFTLSVRLFFRKNFVREEIREKEIMTKKQFDKALDILNKKPNKQVIEREIEIVQFYTLAKKYGFCSPYCECCK